MRVPSVYIYRAFPELDQFSNEVCQNYVNMVKRKHVVSLYAARLISLAASVFVFLGGMYGFLYLSRSMTVVSSDSWIVALMAIVALSFGAASLVFLLTRDKWLRWALRQHLSRAQCGACDYSLLGLPIIDGVAVCPECGTRAELAKLGLTAADLIVDGHAPT